MLANTDSFALPSGRPRRLGRVVSAVGNVIMRHWRAFRNRRAARVLLEWDDRMLADIGLTRHDVRSAMSLPPGEDPTAQLVVRAVERRAAHRAQARERLMRRELGERSVARVD